VVGGEEEPVKQAELDRDAVRDTTGLSLAEGHRETEGVREGEEEVLREWEVVGEAL